MIQILIVAPDQGSFSEFASILEKNNVHTNWAESGAAALALISDKAFELVITDENLGDMTGIELIKKLVTRFPMINCALVSSLTSEAYHEATEGLGVLVQLTAKPDERQAEDLLQHLKTVINLASSTT